MIYCAGQRVDTRPFLEQACATVCQRALPQVQSSLREAPFAIDTVLVAGGGASFYAPAIRQAFKNPQVWVMDDAPLANADGFRIFAGQ